MYREQGVDAPGRLLAHFLPDEYVEKAAARGARRSDAEPYFLYVGRMDAVKGVETLARHFAEGQSPAPLYLAGGGPLEATLRRRFDANPAIRFLGSHGQDELGSLYRDALALILPSAGYEVFGQVVLEGFAHATPAIVTEVGGARELVEASGAGYVYGSDRELAEALEGVAGDPELRDRLGGAGRDYVHREHGEDDYVRRYERLVRELGER